MWRVIVNNYDIGVYEGDVKEGDTIEFGYDECYVLEVNPNQGYIIIESVNRD